MWGNNNFANPPGAGGGITNINISAGTTSQNLSNVVFSNSNGVTFGLNGSTITASAAGGGGGSINFSAGTTSNNLATVVFSNSNGVSFGLNGSTITGSVATSLTNVNLSAGTTSNNLSAFVLSNSNNVSFGLNGSTITGTVTVASTQGSINLSAGTTSNLASAFTFSNSNGISFGLNASTITGSHNAITSQTNQQMTLFATGNTTQSSSGTMNASSIIVRGSNVASVGISNGSIIVDVPAGGGGLTNIRVSAGTTSNLLSDVTFADSNGVSFGINASTITASVAAAAGFTHSLFDPHKNEQIVMGTMGQATLHIQPMYVAFPFQHDRLALRMFFSHASNSTGSITLSHWIGIYTKNASTLSLASSTSQSNAITFSGTASTSLVHGQRILTIGWTNTVSESDYWIGVISRTTSGGANATASQGMISQMNSNFSGVFNAATATSVQRILGFGVLTDSTSAVPGSVAFSNIRGDLSQFHRPPAYFFISGTV